MLSPLMFFQMRLPCKKGIAGCVNVYDMPQISPFQPFPTPSKKNNFHFLKLISQVLVIEIIKNYSTVMNAVNILLQLSHYFIISLFQINQSNITMFSLNWNPSSLAICFHHVKVFYFIDGSSVLKNFDI